MLRAASRLALHLLLAGLSTGSDVWQFFCYESAAQFGAISPRTISRAGRNRS